MTPIFEKINFLGFCRIFGLQTVPAGWPGPGPPIPIFKKFSKKIPKKFFFLIFWMLSLFDVIFHKDDPGKWPLKWLFLNRYAETRFLAWKPCQPPGQDLGPIYHFFKKLPKKILFLKIFAFFAVFDQNSPHHHPYAFPAKKIDFGRKNVLLRIWGG